MVTRRQQTGLRVERRDHNHNDIIVDQRLTGPAGNQANNPQGLTSDDECGPQPTPRELTYGLGP